MKIVFTTLLLIISSACYAQPWTKQAVLSTGDTLHIGDEIKVNKDVTLSDIFPSPNNPAELKDRYKIYLVQDVPGNKYKITKFNRIKRKGQYTPTATFEYFNERMNRFGSAEYTVVLENAIKNAQIEIINK